MTPEQEPLTAWAVIRYLVDALAALAMIVLTMLTGRIKKVETGHTELQQHIRKLEVSTVSRDTHHQHERDVRDLLAEMDRKGEARGERIFDAISELSKRVDGLYKGPDR